MSFFVTSRPIGKGANLGGLAGADAHCQALATSRRRRRSHVARLLEHARAERGECKGPHRRGALVQRQGSADRAKPGGAPRRHAGPRQTRKLGHPRHRDERKGRTDQRGGCNAQSARHADRITAGRTRVHGRRRSYVQQLDERGGDRKRTARDITTVPAAITSRGTQPTRAADAARRTW